MRGANPDGTLLVSAAGTSSVAMADYEIALPPTSAAAPVIEPIASEANGTTALFSPSATGPTGTTGPVTTMEYAR